jgi:hypothetical protein
MEVNCTEPSSSVRLPCPKYEEEEEGKEGGKNKW